MTKYQDAVDTIKSSISALDVANAFGLEVDRHGRCRCPFHNGVDRNMKLFSGDRGFHCFVCHASGDSIKLAQELLGPGATFKQTVTWFNDTFGLGMDIDSPVDPEALRKAQRRAEEARKERELQLKTDRLRYDALLAADKVLCDLEEIRDDHMPQDADGDWDNRFCFAVKMIPVTKRLVDDLEMFNTDRRR